MSMMRKHKACAPAGPRRLRKAALAFAVLLPLLLLACAACGSGQEGGVSAGQESAGQQGSGVAESAGQQTGADVVVPRQDTGGDRRLENIAQWDDGGQGIGLPAKLTLGTGGTGGTYYPYGSAAAAALMGQIEGLDVTVLATGASQANLYALADGAIDMAIAQNDVMDYAAKGTALFVEALGGFSAVAGLYPEPCQIVARPGTGSVEGLRGKNVSIGEIGSGVSFNAVEILEAYGMSVLDVKVYHLGYSESALAYMDGAIDAFFCVAGAPTAAVAVLAPLRDFELLEISSEHADRLIGRYPFYTRYTIAGGTYEGIGEDVETVAVKAALVASDRLGGDLVYAMTKALFACKGEIAAAHSKGAFLDPAYATEGISIPFHPGALRYYEEAGVQIWAPDMTQP